MTQHFSSNVESIGASASASVLPINIQVWFPLGLIGLISLQSRRLSRIFSSTTIWKHQFFGAQPSLWSISHIYTWLLEKPQLWFYTEDYSNIISVLRDGVKGFRSSPIMDSLESKNRASHLPAYSFQRLPSVYRTQAETRHLLGVGKGQSGSLGLADASFYI